VETTAKSDRNYRRTSTDGTDLKTLNPLKVPFGTAKGVALRNVKYLQWEDAFEVDFEDGLTFLEPHATIRKANKIDEKARVKSVELEGEFHHGFFVHYDNGQMAEVSWSFIRELPPKRNLKSLLDHMEAIVISAIKNRHVLSFFYGGALRTVEPQTYGISTAGHPVLRGYQVAGGSKTGQTVGLRLYELAKMEGLKDTGRRFAKAQPQHRPKDSAMSKVIVSLPLPKAA
jgi:hypothetical protein